MPVIIKHTVMELQVSVGGMHSGCGVSCIMWLIYVGVLLCSDFYVTNVHPWPIVTFAFVLLGATALSCASAYPTVRSRHHELFENVHRYSGWSSLILLGVFVILLDFYMGTTESYQPSAEALAKHFELWAVVLATCIIVAPWAAVRKVRCETLVQNKKTLMLKFEGSKSAGLFCRLSLKPLYEWHAFACVSPDADDNAHYVIISAAGDFTKAIIADPPQYVYTRVISFVGLPSLTPLYQRAVIVCTGAGLSPYMSHIFQARNEIHLIWVGKDLLGTFGSEVMGWLERALPSNRLAIIDTTQGRPDLVELACKAYWELKAQVVLVGSNPDGTEAIKLGCRRNLIPCFGPVWDS